MDLFTLALAKKISGGTEQVSTEGRTPLIVSLTEQNETVLADVEVANIVTSIASGTPAFVRYKGAMLPIVQAEYDNDSGYSVFASTTTVLQADGVNFMLYMTCFYDGEQDRWIVNESEDLIFLTDCEPYKCDGVLGQDAQQRQTVTMHMTAEQLYNIISLGKSIKLTLTQDESTVTYVIAMDARKTVNADKNIKYFFRYHADKAYASEQLSRDEQVMLTETM